jgi:uncharacterized membrane protein YvlD (DUF360 family)
MCLHTSLILIQSFKRISKLKTPSPFLRDSIFVMSVAFFTVLIAGMVNSRVYYEYFWWQLALAAIVFSLVNKMVRQEAEERKSKQ